MSADSDPNSDRVIVIGAGAGGIAAGIALKTQLGPPNFTIYDSGDDVGGTWRDNTYPGCASDVYTHWYSLSTDLNPNWDNTHVFQPQLFQYWQDVCRKYSLYEHCMFHNEATAAQWDASAQVWRVEVKNLRTGQSYIDTAKAIISAVGTLCVPNYPRDLDGVRTRFKGRFFHSARWDHSVDLRHKRVAVIGNGCSAAQFLPVIPKNQPFKSSISGEHRCGSSLAYAPFGSSEISLKIAYAVQIRRAYSELEKWIFRNIPIVMRLYRWGIVAWQEFLWLMIMTLGLKNPLRPPFMKYLTYYMKKKAPKKYHDILTPDYPFGCKRLIVDTGYYDMLHRPNVALSDDGIVDITEVGILTKNGKRFPFDVIILATGFITDKYPFAVRGSKGITLDEYYEQHDGPTAYYGTAVPGFPNFFMLAGPNTTTGHGSVIFTEEVQVNYIMKLLKPILQGSVSSLTVTSEATDAYNSTLQTKLSTSVWSACDSWYHVRHTGKISSIWPGSFIQLWWRLRSPRWGDYEVVGAKEEWRKPRSKVRWVEMLYGVIVAGFVFWFDLPRRVWYIIWATSRGAFR
ncbi:FAD/NAD(P)-binding domain-containing protein [Panus rudis PR-1116 ss-1]|nr:FAD/NAD(P)-binding domain-containing protein [Panus rudis PR-1116 ss-1]